MALMSSTPSVSPSTPEAMPPPTRARPCQSDRGVEGRSSTEPPNRMRALRCCAYSLPVTPQMLLLAVQRLNPSKGASLTDIINFVKEHFPVVVSNDLQLADEVRRKLALCVHAGVLEVERGDEALLCSNCQGSWLRSTTTTTTTTATTPLGVECDACRRSRRFKPHGDIALGKLESAHLQRFYTAVVEQSETALPPKKNVRLWWYQRVTRRVIESARNLADKVSEGLDAEEENCTQTDNRVTDWVNPDIADADYIN